MIIDPEAVTYQSALRTHSRAIRDLLRGETPLRAALRLEENGWPREWACCAVHKLELEHNPAGLHHGPRENQAKRDRLNLRAMGGGFICAVCLLLGIVALLRGKIPIGPGVGFCVGASIAMSAFAELKKYPDRRLPTYIPPKDLRGHRPGEY